MDLSPGLLDDLVALWHVLDEFESERETTSLTLTSREAGALLLGDSLDLPDVLEGSGSIL
jgi:hypothetical protein